MVCLVSVYLKRTLQWWFSLYRELELKPITFSKMLHLSLHLILYHNFLLWHFLLHSTLRSVDDHIISYYIALLLSFLFLNILIMKDSTSCNISKLISYWFKLVEEVRWSSLWWCNSAFVWLSLFCRANYYINPQKCRILLKKCY